MATGRRRLVRLRVSAMVVASALILVGCGDNGETTFAVEEHQAFAEPRELRSAGGELAATLTVGEGPADLRSEIQAR